MADLLLLVAGGAAAGVFGALLGLGGGILIVPLLTLGFGLPFRESVGVSLVCVIVTSNAAASVYLRRDVANLRLGMTLEMFTASAALAGGLVAFALPDKLLAVLFAGLLAYVAVVMARGRAPDESLSGVEAADPPAAAEAPEESAPASHSDALSGEGYRVRHLGLGAAGSLFAGFISAVFGIGGGIVKVPVMNLVMGVPLRVAAATSNMMIGVTASTGAIIYLLRGGIDPYVAAPTAIGVFAGATAASQFASRFDMRLLRAVFVVVLAFTAIQMLLRGIS
jgi:uncharacterized membrane protein YfcA